ncbi:uncharacterized protein [Gossypium hirsutum]|uniref:Integrase zinc-binding domain-containing protein n=1 Tax=Gossypium hirsutum TaxID=3635 RepID=A0A1U8P899_GOSHI|nr:uncharacterized protein LOC107956135 [Gossypium hirsutum]
MTDLRVMFARLSLFDDRGLLAELQVKPTWIDQIRDKLLGDESLGLQFRQIESGNTSDFGLNKDRVLCFRGQVCVPNDFDLRQLILMEAHSGPYAMHPGGNKMHLDLHELYWWSGLELVFEIEDKVRLIRDRLKAASDMQKSYTNLKKRDIEYSISDLIFLKVYWTVSDSKACETGRLSVELPPKLDRIHNVFYISMLRRYQSDPSHVISVDQIGV